MEQNRPESLQTLTVSSGNLSTFCRRRYQHRLCQYLIIQQICSQGFLSCSGIPVHCLSAKAFRRNAIKTGQPTGEITS